MEARLVGCLAPRFVLASHSADYLVLGVEWGRLILGNLTFLLAARAASVVDCCRSCRFVKELPGSSDERHGMIQGVWACNRKKTHAPRIEALLNSTENSSQDREGITMTLCVCVRALGVLG